MAAEFTEEVSNGQGHGKVTENILLGPVTHFRMLSGKGAAIFQCETPAGSHNSARVLIS